MCLGVQLIRCHLIHRLSSLHHLNLILQMSLHLLQREG